MPEGDTIFRTAATLSRALEGQPVTEAVARAPQPRQLGIGRLVGQRVASVEPRGKHLLHWFSPSDLALHTHMRMSGSWHLYRVRERWRKPEHYARVVLTVPDWVAVCFSAPVCELLTRAQVERHPSLATLGPDPLGEDGDLGEARRRLDQRSDVPVGEALQDQRVLAGIGNVYRCEILFIHAIDPWIVVGDLDGGTRDAVLATAARLLEENVRNAGPRRTTTDRTAGAPRLHVYGRAGRACPRCATPIAVARQGAFARVTYWYPSCQGPGSPSHGGSTRRGR